MTLTYPSQWASFHGWTQDRLELSEAIEFVEAIQNLQFGELLEIEANSDEFPGVGGDEVRAETEQEIQTSLQRVSNWLHTLQSEGQETISQQKVIAKIESETGYPFQFS